MSMRWVSCGLKLSLVCLFCVVGICAQQVRAASGLASNAGAAASSVPRLVRFNGTLQDGTGKPLAGPVEVTFELFAQQSGGEPLWWETQTVEVDAEGRYSVLLGAMHPDGLPMDLFTAGEARWLGVAVGKIEQPRVLLVSVPYAFKAGDAETLGGKPATAFVSSDQLKEQVQSELQAATGSTSIGLRSVEMMVTNPATTPQAITETGPSTFTCSSQTNCVTVTQNGAGHALAAISRATSGIAQGVHGESLSPTGRGVYGVVNQPTGVNYGVRGDSASVSGRGVLGYASAATGLTYGLYGLASSNGGVGLLGHATSATGATIGLRGIVSSAEGTAGEFENRGGGQIISGRSGASLVEKFSVDGSGNVTAAGIFTGDGSGLTGVPSSAGGTVTSVGSGLGLTGGPITSTGTLSVNTSVVPFLAASNTFVGNQTITGNLSLAGSINGGFTVQTTAGTPNLIGGNSSNSVPAGVVGATIGGGGSEIVNNRVTDDYGTVGGGEQNHAGDNAGTTSDATWATVGGGSGNDASNYSATVAGGADNTASGFNSTVGGGGPNSASGSGSTVSGGTDNSASGQSATVPGGYMNTAQGAYSFAAGCGASALHDGSFVWSGKSSDCLNPPLVSSTAVNQFIVRAAGGVAFYTSANMSTGCSIAAGGGSWSCTSDRHAKTNFADVNGRALLTRLATVPILTWNYKTQDATIRHIGPMAQDFYAAFGVGEDNKHIATVDADGVALAAIQALYKLSLEKDRRIAELERPLDELQRKLEEKN
jgi:hypothetical protein